MSVPLKDPVKKSVGIGRSGIGIDVGGTFTHAVLLTGIDNRVTAFARVPTSHRHSDGLAHGVAMAIECLLRQAKLSPDLVSRVAYSTTQATNALLEGDVCKVGILAAGRGWEGRRAGAQCELKSVELDPACVIQTVHAYLDVDNDDLEETSVSLLDRGAEAIVIAAAFSVDEPEREDELSALVCGHTGLPVTVTHEISSLYGLRARTRTAVVNAAILPGMLETAEKTEQAVRRLGISAPIVVMRSDGGAMSLEEMRRRPVLTILSGPAAGVAAALMAARVSDAVFVEVGGTSTDISCIRDGRPFLRPARIGGHRLYLNTIDVRTVGVAGGSLPRVVKSRGLVGLGPRSAHIAGLAYASFSGRDDGLSRQARRAEITSLAPLPGDPPDYIAFSTSGALPGLALTPTCAANFLGMMADGDDARISCQQELSPFFEQLGKFSGCSAQQAARAIIDKGAGILGKVVACLLEEYGLSPDETEIVAGGGGAGVWCSVLGEMTGCRARIVDFAPVISAIGAATALLQETVERTLVKASPEELAKLREEARAAVIRSGAVEETIEVRVEVDKARGVIRATAMGSGELCTAVPVLSMDELTSTAERLMKVDEVELCYESENFVAFSGERVYSAFFGFFRSRRRCWCVLDRSGRVRVNAADGCLCLVDPRDFAAEFRRTMKENAEYGDAGMSLPDAFLVVNRKIVDLCGLMDIGQRLGLCDCELSKNDHPASKVLVAVRKS